MMDLDEHPIFKLADSHSAIIFVKTENKGKESLYLLFCYNTIKKDPKFRENLEIMFTEMRGKGKTFHIKEEFKF